MMKKLIVVLTFLWAMLPTEAKNIFFPVYINSIEHYKDGVLVNKYITTGDWSTTIINKNYIITVSSIESIRDPVKEYLANKRAKTLAVIASVAYAASSVAYSIDGITSSNNWNRFCNYFNSSIAMNNAALSMDLASYFHECEKSAVILPVTCIIENTSDTIIDGSEIIRAHEKYELNCGKNYNSWRFSDKNGNIYYITSFHSIAVKKGIISQELKVAFVDPDKTEKSHKNQVKRIDLKTYESKWVTKDNEEYLNVKEHYDWDDGYQSSKEQ